ncbi:ATP-binding cassette subfamily B protein [Kitasatospora gansuensis]|uniref:ATP-binding cassette subfamily B protein n=1 Tax=Kitasatospora gansuensis TaxID=258050 RepID=A0A7W7SK00_9ACTN|nr:ABC transporter ATP-binding protein [Kitasatospora gansuensis]MBB4951293.1 ATP-binding cassette subfamily B protein [Kitasatospora gansuensis]
MKTRPTEPLTDESVSDSEQFLFGGRLRYDYGFTSHEQTMLKIDFLTVARQIPGLLRTALRLAWQADRTALVVIAVAEIGRALAAAFGLLATSRALASLFASGGADQLLRAALPAALAVGGASALSALLGIASSWAGGRLEPKTERAATVAFLQGAARVELASLEDPDFSRLLESARFGTAAVRRLISQSIAVLTALLGLAAAGGVLLTLDPVLMPMLILIAAPKGWGAVRSARRRYGSMMAWLQHHRASALLAQLITQPHSAPEVRVHAIGPFILGHYTAMAEASEQEQNRLARAAATTSVLASALSGLAAAATFAVLGWFVHDGQMALAVAGTAVVGIRTGAADITSLVRTANGLYEEALFVADLERLQREAGRRAIPTGGTDLPHRPDTITLEGVGFTYPGRTTPALTDITLEIPRGKVVALVGDNGSGKSTLVKVLCGLYLPDNGRILWDGTDTAGADRDQLFSSVAVLEQDFQRWPFTLRANVLVGRPEHGDDPALLKGAADYADLHPVVEAQDRGWDTLAARGFQGGVQLSGGQWQRVGAARTHVRALTNGPGGRPTHLVIADEPTSALDAQSEIAAFARIRELADQGLTVILITHRLGATADADLIHVLHEGRLSESGTHSELMADPDGGYRAAYLLQAGQFAAEVPGVGSTVKWAVPAQNGQLSGQFQGSAGNDSGQ